jgi:preprotein translocase subunit Sec63
MSPITTKHLSLAIQSLKKLLSFKADKTEVVFRNELVTDESQIEMLIKADMLPAVYNIDGKILTDENENILLRY